MDDILMLTGIKVYVCDWMTSDEWKLSPDGKAIYLSPQSWDRLRDTARRPPED